MQSTIPTTAVSELMTKTAIHWVSPDATVRKAAERMKEVHSGSLVVLKGGKLVGIVTERDLVQRVIAEGKPYGKTLISQIMSKPVITTTADAPISDAAKLMLKNKIRRLPVTKGKKVIGMLTTTDYAKYLSKKKVKDTMLAATARAEYQTIFE